MAHWIRRAATTTERAKQILAELWGDRPSRAYALSACAALWLSVTLTEPAFLALGAAALLGLRHRTANRPEPSLDEDDWL
jgi:hypothetical protein